MTRPPLLARALLRLLLPRHAHEAVAGDLEEQWHEDRNARRFWILSVRSVLDCRAGALRVRARSASPLSPGDAPMHALWQDTRYALRLMARSPGFTLAATVTLALGIGANAAVFSIVNVLSLKPLPYEDPSRVVFVLGRDTETGDLRFSMRVADFLDIRRSVSAFQEVAAYSYLSANLTGGDIPDRVQAYRVTPNTFDLLGVPPAIGRPFTAADARGGAGKVVIISDGLWRRRFGGEAAVIGRTVAINGSPHQVVGVMPLSFEYPVFNFKGDAWLPWTIDQAAALTDRSRSGSATVVARLRTDVTEPQAAAELEAFMKRLAKDHPASNATLTARVVQMGRLDDEEAGPAMAIALAAVGLVLLLACANVANLLLARGVSRSRELAVRAAVGATRWRIVRQLTVESLLLAAAGTTAGLVAAMLALDSLLAIAPEMVLTTVPNVRELGVDAGTLAFTIVIALATTILFGVVPAWRASRWRVQDSLKEGAAAGGSRGTRRMRSVLVVAEVALATLLAIGAALLARSYAEVQRIHPGFEPEGLLTLTVSLPEDRYPSPERRRQFYDAVLRRLQETPGIRNAAMVNVLPFSTYDRGVRFVAEGTDFSPGRELRASFRIATPGYFSTLGIPLLSGRSFDERDSTASLPVAIVNRTFAKRYFGDADPLGRRVKIGAAGADEPWITVIGVTGDVHHWSLTQAADPELYLPLSQAADTSMMMLAASTDLRPSDLVPAVRREILAVDPAQPMYHVQPMTRALDTAMLARTTSASMVGLFGTMALVLALIGVYGVVSYGVNQQMPEFGVRLALGATPMNIARLVMARGTLLVVMGVGLGTAAALAASAGLRAVLYGIGPTDPVTYATVVVLVATLGCAACLIPARRAALTGPVSALRAE